MKAVPKLEQVVPKSAARCNYAFCTCKEKNMTVLVSLCDVFAAFEVDSPIVIGLYSTDR